MGIASGTWDAGPWRDSLSHYGRIVHVCVEFAIAQNEDQIFPYDGDFFGVFERSFVIAAFSIRRLAEKRLLTDSLNERKWSVTSYPASDKVRPPLPGSTSNEFYRGYRFDKRSADDLTLKEFGNEVIHSSNLGIVTEPEGVSCGIVVASDHRLSRRLLHVTVDDWATMCSAVLEDRVYIASDDWDPITGKTTAKRLGRADI